MNYGTFKDEKKTELIGFGRVKLYNRDIAWLEGGRIKVSYQRQGIGRKQLKFAIDYAIKVGAKVAQYDTGSNNFASISLAKHFGFKQKKRMDLVEAQSDDIKITRNIVPKLEKLNAKEVKEHYKEFEISPGTEICVGWSYIPLKHSTDEQGSWIYNGDAILQKMELRSFHTHEIPLKNEYWIIVYGKPKAAFDLIQYAIQTQLESQESKTYEVFCKPEVVDLLKEIGFKYYEDERFGVILFEKTLN